MEKYCYIYLGTMAELIKMMGVMQEFKKRKIPYVAVLSGQHELQNSDLWKIAGEPERTISLFDKPVRKSIGAFALWTIKSLFSGVVKLRKEFRGKAKKDILWIISCDTISTGLGALLGFFFRIKTAHIEAGLTSKRWLLPFPEELTRAFASAVADIIYCPNQWCVENLKKYNGLKVDTQQNTIMDSLRIALAKQPTDPVVKEFAKKKYFVFSIHRQENIYRKKIFQFLISEVLKASQGYTCLFMMYDLTLMMVKKVGMWEELTANRNIRLIPRMPYMQYMHLLRNSQFLITDGGSNQEDSYLLGKPCLIMRDVTERIEGLNENVVLFKSDPAVLSDFIRNFKSLERKPQNLKFSPSKIIVDTLF